MNRGILILLLIISFSCKHNSNENTSINDMKINSDIQRCDSLNNESLVLLIHSGGIMMTIQNLDTTVVSETQIIYCSPNSVKYGYGSVLSETDTIKNDLEWFTEYSNIDDYSIREKNLDTEEQAFFKKSIKKLSNTRYENPMVIKDDWEYILLSVIHS